VATAPGNFLMIENVVHLKKMSKKLMQFVTLLKLSMLNFSFEAGAASRNKAGSGNCYNKVMRLRIRNTDLNCICEMIAL
jgi:hypothetical protein